MVLLRKMHSSTASGRDVSSTGAAASRAAIHQGHEPQNDPYFGYYSS